MDERRQEQALYRFSGTVVRGKGLGRLIGMPAAGIELPAAVRPPWGVYASSVLWESKQYMGATYIGPHLTINDRRGPCTDTYLLRFEGDLYGQVLQIRLLKKLREPVHFSTVSRLKEQFHRDCGEAACVLGPRGMEDQRKTVWTGGVKLYGPGRTAVWNGAEIELTAKEFDVLLLLLREKGRVVSKQELYERVWRAPANGCCHQVENVVSQLRKKFAWGRDARGGITAVRGAGYRYNPP